MEHDRISKHEHEKNYHNYIPYVHNVEKNVSMLRRNMKDIKMIQTDLERNHTYSLY